ncbi:fatty acid-binding protein, liver-like [Leptodactylus fuscus]|uniref:fatty acid-binding protein, liver-like n=1 Tax=Leptodactylus fuscus TaxID=238119 RepID=UPI003F4E7678
MSFSGTYELQSHENFEPFMKAVGIPELFISKAKDAKTITSIEQNGNHFVITVTTGPKVIRNEFNIGEETEFETFKKEKVKTTVNLVDGKLVMQLKAVTSVIEVSGDILTGVLSMNDIVYKKVSKRIA